MHLRTYNFTCSAISNHTYRHTMSLTGVGKIVGVGPDASMGNFVIVYTQDPSSSNISVVSVFCAEVRENIQRSEYEAIIGTYVDQPRYLGTVPGWHLWIKTDKPVMDLLEDNNQKSEIYLFT